MNKLNLIKIRLLKRLNVSQEDWWDDLRNEYLGDNFLDSGDVDKAEDFEIAENLKVKEQSWTALLTRGDDNMIPYANVYGNSGVAAYDSGVDWFLIRFKDGSLYLYTKASVDSEHIEYMRKLAYQGSGLNSFVNRIIGSRYAGRNYKGAITMMPGMENHSDSRTLRALQLIIAHENTLMNETISQEGIGDLIKKAGQFLTGKDEHGVRKSDRKPGAHVKNDGDQWYSKENEQDWKTLKETITKYYLNDRWLDHQKLTEGSVKADDFSGAFTFNGKNGPDALKNVENGLKYRSEFAKRWQPIVNAYAAKLNAIQDKLEKATKGATDADPKLIAIVEKGTKELNAVPSPLAQLPKMPGSGLGNLYPTVGDYKGTKYLAVKEAGPLVKVDKLPALNKEQIKHAAKLILQLTHHERDMDFVSWPDFEDGSDFNEWIYEADNNVYMEHYDKISQQGCDQKLVEPVGFLVPNFGYSAAAALEKWIDRSIKGNVSVEEHVTSKLEVLEQEAGLDGLEPNAVEALNIAVELFK